LDEDGVPLYNKPSDKFRYKVGTNGAHLIVPFQCDLCIFRTLFKRDPRDVIGDKQNCAIIRRINLDVIWSREPSTVAANMRSLAKLIAMCESSGITPQLPPLGPLSFEDSSGFCIAFGMIRHSMQPGRHSTTHTQFATIRKQRSAFSNLYQISKAGSTNAMTISIGSQPQANITACPTNSLWFSRWTMGCETRMGFILKQNQAISLEVLKAMIKNFKQCASRELPQSWKRQEHILGMVYCIICFCASLRGGEGLQIPFDTLVKHLDRGRTSDKRHTGKVLHVVVPLLGRFKGEKGERCHLVPLAHKTASGIPIRSAIDLLVAARKEMEGNVYTNWAFVNQKGGKMTFGEMNEIIISCLERVKDVDERTDFLGLKDHNVREDFSINRSFRRGSTAHARNMKVPVDVVEVQNRWRKFERAKGKRARLSMIENYSDIEQLVPTLIRYSSML
jgi:hypothetical protein